MDLNSNKEVLRCIVAKTARELVEVAEKMNIRKEQIVSIGHNDIQFYLFYYRLKYDE